MKSLTQVRDRVGDLSQGTRTWLTSDWRVPVALSLAITGGLSALSIGFLLKLPAVPNCPSIFWPLASGSLRLHCAQLAAGKRTANDLLEGIQLLSTLPPDHPLYDEAKRLIELWSKDILDLGEEAFHAGKLDEAIATVKRVPQKSAVYGEVEARVKRWQDIWSQAEDTYRKAEEALRKENWQKASTEAGRLLSVDNVFWQTVKYQELTDKIAMTRDDIGKLTKAKDLLEQGGIKNLEEAVKLAAAIKESSYVYGGAQTTIAKAGRKMLDLAEAVLDQKDLNGALDITRKIPAGANLQKDIEDFERLANAQARTWSGNDADYDLAIADAQTIQSGRPLHSKAQKLIARLQAEKGDLAQLNRARQLAQSNRPEDLQAAIASASNIPSSNPKSAEARQLVNQVSSQLQSSQDRPIIDQAERLANAGDKASLQSAIDTIDRISSDRALYEEARQKRRSYRERLREIQRQEEALRQPSPSPTTFGNSPSQSSTSNPDANLLADQQTLDMARSAANGGTIDDYAKAIQLANGVPGSSPLRDQAQQYMNQLSQQMLQAAQNQASFDTLSAISAAEKIPSGTSAYGQAQQLIQQLRKTTR